MSKCYKSVFQHNTSYLHVSVKHNMYGGERMGEDRIIHYDQFINALLG